MRSEESSNNIYFFDSYAMIEMISGNKYYQRFWQAKMITSKLNIFEVVYWLLKLKKDNLAIDFVKNTIPVTVDIDESTLINAAAFRLQHKKKRLSMADCIGYMLAQQFEIPFLTGDKEFEHIDGVKFVK